MSSSLFASGGNRKIQRLIIETSPEPHYFVLFSNLLLSVSPTMRGSLYPVSRKGSTAQRKTKAHICLFVFTSLGMVPDQEKLYRLLIYRRDTIQFTRLVGQISEILYWFHVLGTWQVSAFLTLPAQAVCFSVDYENHCEERVAV